MIELSIGILILAICILLFSEKENKKRIQSGFSPVEKQTYIDYSTKEGCHDTCWQ